MSALKRKSSPASPRARKSSRRLLPWGEQKEDLKPVKISIEKPLITEVNALQQFHEVSYTEYMTGEQITAPVYKGRSFLMVEKSVETDLRHKLGPLIQNLKPLENLVATPGERNVSRWDWKTGFDASHIDQLCEAFFIAFKFNMMDTDGKIAMSELLREITARLNMKKTLRVLPTGCGKASRYACLLELDYFSKDPSPTSSSSSEGYVQEYVNYSVPHEMKESSLVLRSTVQKDSPTCPGSSLPDKQSPPRQKRRVSDILVYSQKSLHEPIVSHLVVSIKSSKSRIPEDLIQELLARLPYQSGVIYGLQINYLDARLFSVEKDSQASGPAAGPAVKLSSYPEYHFQTMFSDFDFLPFQKMVLDIGFILMAKS